MSKTTIIAVPIYANPKDFPVNNLKKLEKDLKSYLVKDVGPMLKGDMEDTTKNWSQPPVFVVKYSEPYGTRMQIDVYPTGRGTLNWKRVSEGTGPRPIRAKPGSMMIFPRDYIPKTTPGGKYGGPGIRAGNIVKTTLVRSHSIAPRKFTLKIKEKREKSINDGIQKVVQKAGR